MAIEDGVLSLKNEVFKQDNIEKQNRIERDKNIKNPTSNQNRNQMKISGDLNKKRSNFMKRRNTGNKTNGNNINKDSIKSKDLRNQNKSYETKMNHNNRNHEIKIIKLNCKSITGNVQEIQKLINLRGSTH
jgi:hypothetical protein